MSKNFSDFTEQVVADATNILSEDDLNADKGKLITGLGIFTYLQTKGFLTETEIQALSGLTMPTNFIAGGEVRLAATTITLDSALYCRDDNDDANIVLSSGFNKVTGSTFAAGTGLGGLDTGTIAANTFYYLFAIYNPTTEASDVLFSLSETSPTLPSGYTKKRLIGGFRTYFESTNINIKIGVDWANIRYALDNYNELPTNYIDPLFEITVTVPSVTYLNFTNFQCRDDSDSYNLLSNTASLAKKTLGTFVAGDSSGIFQTAIAADTIYYLYIISKAEGKTIDFLASVDDPSTITLPTGYSLKRLIGFLQTLNGTTTDFMVWTINEKWEDENFDVANLGKPNSIVTSAPGYEALFSGSSNTILVSTFDSDGAQAHYIDAGIEHPHAAKNDFPFHFHAHCYPEDANSGNIVLFLDYIITYEGDTNAVAAPTRITKTAAVPGVLGEQFTVNFDWIIPTAIQEGSQIWFTFGRLSTDAADTYASKIAIRTFGIHYCKDKKGSDLETTNV